MGATVESLTDQDRVEFLQRLFGVEYYTSKSNVMVASRDDDLYYYNVFVGKHEVQVEQGDCIYFLSEDKKPHIFSGGQ